MLKVFLPSLLLCSAAWAQSIPMPNITGPICESCGANDLIFVIDASQSIPDANYQAEITFIENILSNAKTEQPKWGDLIGTTVKVSIIVFKSHIVSQLSFTSATSYQTVYNYLESIRSISPSGSSNLCAAEQAADKEFDKLGRAGIPKTLMILTDGDPNSNGQGCTPTTAVQLATTMKTTASLSVEILCIAVAGDDGYQPASNLPFLSQIASMGPVNGQQAPMVWSLQDGNALQQAEASITARMSCCSCYPDVSQTVEIDDKTQGSSNSLLQQVFSNVNSVASYWFGQNAKYNLNSAQALVILGNQTASQIVIQNCNAMSCWNNKISSGCPRVLPGSPDQKDCDWFSGNADISAALAQNDILIKHVTGWASATAPNVNIMHMTGTCTVTAPSQDCSNKNINAQVSLYQTDYYVRIGSIIYVGPNGSGSNPSMVYKVVGNTGTVVKGPGPSGVTDNSGCLIYQIARALSDIPGCSAQPYLNDPSLQNTTCQYYP